MIKLIGFLWIFIIAMFASCSTLPIDRAVSSEAGNSAKSIVWTGCGDVARLGHLYCEVSEGSLTDAPISMILPPGNCDRASCVEFQVFRKGSPGFHGAIPKGQTEFKFTLADLAQTGPNVDPSIDDEYRVQGIAYWKDNQGIEHRQPFHGFVRIDVTTKDFMPVACGGPEVAWNVAINKTCSAQFTTAARAALCGLGCK